MNNVTPEFRDEYRVLLEAEVAGKDGFEFRPLVVGASSEYWATKSADNFRTNKNYRNIRIEHRTVQVITSDWSEV